MNQQVTKSSLSTRRRLLVEFLQEHPFCRIESLQVRAGEPLFTPPPKVILKLKMGADNGRRPESELPDFWLKRQFIDLLDTITELGDGEIRLIDVQHGLPLVVEIERRPAFGQGGGDA